MGKKNTKEALADETNILVYSALESRIGGIIGGFPCQDISVAGGGQGIQRSATNEALTRSGLFWEMAKTFRLVRPYYWLMENVAELFNRGMGDILGFVASCGYYAEWDCVGAGTVGAPHHRARAYILAYDPSCGGERRYPRQICRQPEYASWENVRSIEDLRRRSDLPEPLIRRKRNGAGNRLHGIGNSNPPCVIRELTKGLKI